MVIAGLRFMMDKYKARQDQKQKQGHIHIVKPESGIGGVTKINALAV